ncbi:MAG: YeeE/YedE thiosulfate transporter family protein [Acidiferrobacter sp.]
MGIMLHQIFGESTTYSWVVAVLIMPTYKYSVGVLNHIGWEPFSDIGTFLGAFFSAVLITKRFTAFRKVVPPSWRNRFGNEDWKRAIGVFAGSYLMLFGARMADGCASGHILSGVVQMAASGIYFGVVVMITGVIAAKIIYGNVSEKVNP